MSSRTTRGGPMSESKFEGADITKDISPYLISATYTDNEEERPTTFSSSSRTVSPCGWRNG